MNSFERLEDEACKDGIDVFLWKFQSERIKGLYSDGIIGINERLETSVEKPVRSPRSLDTIIHLLGTSLIWKMSQTGNRNDRLVSGDITS